MKNLNLQIHGMNEINRVATEIAKEILPRLTGFIGKKIITNKGLSSKLKEVKPLDIRPTPLMDGFGSLNYNVLDYYGETLVLKTTICLNGGKYKDNTYYCEYFNKTIRIGYFYDESYKLKSLVEFIPEPEIINLEVELKKIEMYKIHLELANKIKQEIKLPSHVYKY